MTTLWRSWPLRSQSRLTRVIIAIVIIANTLQAAVMSIAGRICIA